jgi:hypothetical protein
MMMMIQGFTRTHTKKTLNPKPLLSYIWVGLQNPREPTPVWKQQKESLGRHSETHRHKFNQRLS